MRLAAVIGSWLFAACAAPSVVGVLDVDALRVTVDGEPFATVHFAASPRPFVFPVVGPDGVALTRSFPMADVAGETKDHPHHVSLWFAHGDVNGFDFWQGKAHRERIEWDRNLQLLSVDDRCSLRCGYRWLVDDGTLVCTEERELLFSAPGDEARVIDVTVTLRATDRPLVLGDTKEGTFAVRVHEALRVDGSNGAARLVNSEGQVDAAVWGRRARWIDARGTIDGRDVGIALFDHPDNHAHPTWWHARTYGLLAANPFGVHDFEKRPAGTGTLTLPAGGSLRLRYRVLLHGADWNAASLDAAWQAWVAR